MVSDNIAKNIKQLRDMRGMSQQALARAAGVPRPTLGHLETGSANPTVSVLIKVAAGLQVSVEELISPPRASFRKYQVTELAEKKRGGVTVRRVLPDALQSVDLDRMEFAPGARMGGVPHRTGTREYLACETGTVELTVSGEKVSLQPGECLVFRGDQKHSYFNPGSSVSIAYSAVLLGPLAD